MEGFELVRLGWVIAAGAAGDCLEPSTNVVELLRDALVMLMRDGRAVGLAGSILVSVVSRPGHQ